MLSEQQLAALRMAVVEPNRLRVAMALVPVTQVQLAEALGVEQSYISKIVNGRYSRMSLEVAQKLAAYFGCTTDDLFPARAEVA